MMAKILLITTIFLTYKVILTFSTPLETHDIERVTTVQKRENGSMTSGNLESDLNVNPRNSFTPISFLNEKLITNYHPKIRTSKSKEDTKWRNRRSETAKSIFTNFTKPTAKSEEYRSNTVKDAQVRHFGIGSSGWGWGGGGSGGHGIGFPSLEGALLTLAFLTFAVFLVDLIQQILSRFRTVLRLPIIGRRKRESVGVSIPNLASVNELSSLTSAVFRALEKPSFNSDFLYRK